ncbi:DUF4125 family protein [Thermodesulfobacteriota bacterium]
MDIPDMKREGLIKEVLDLEWEMFTNVNSANGRASCQDDTGTFMIMRRAQAGIWSADTLTSYLNDLRAAKYDKRNLMAEKYARMMEATFPEEYEILEKQLPAVSDRSRELAREIVKYHLKWSMEASGKYPKFFSLGRPVSGNTDRSNSIENYLKSELLTYSEETLELCLKDTIAAADNDTNLSIEILKNTARSYGFDSLDAIEEKFSGEGK